MVNSNWLRVEGGRVFLIFDFRFLIESGEKFGVWKQVAGPEAGVPTKTREVSSCRKRRGGRCGFTALSGWKVGKAWNFYRLWAGSTRLFPHKSTQVVDFPLLSRLRVFWLRVERGGGQWTVDNWQWIANRGNESNRTNGTNLETERSLMFAYVRLKSLMFAFFEKSIWGLSPDAK